MLDFQGARYLMKGEVPQQVGNNHPTGAPTGTYRTRDGYINIAPTPPMWRRFCTAIGRRRSDRRIPTTRPPACAARTAPSSTRCIEEITIEAGRAPRSIEKLNAAGIPCGPIYAIDQAFADPQVRHLGIAQQVVSKALGPITLLGQPVTLSRTPSRLATAAPEYGEHTDDVLRELGYSAAEIDGFRKSGAI